MKLSNNNTAKYLYYFSNVAMIFYIIFLAVNVFSSGIPSSGKGVKAYNVYDVKIAPKNIETSQSQQTDVSETLDRWFNDTLIIRPVQGKGLVLLRFQSISELFSFPAIVYQISQLFYWFLIGFLIFCIRKLFKSFNNNTIFTDKNASLIIFGSIGLMFLPIMRWITQELFINCITKLNLNNSDYILQNGAHVFSSETIIGLVLLAFGAAFKSGVTLKTENESFI